MLTTNQQTHSHADKPTTSNSHLPIVYLYWVVVELYHGTDDENDVNNTDINLNNDDDDDDDVDHQRECIIKRDTCNYNCVQMDTIEMIGQTVDPTHNKQYVKRIRNNISTVDHFPFNFYFQKPL